MSTHNNIESLESYIYQIVLWFVIFILIIFRIYNYASNADSWIWIVNYIGMAIACLNLFVTKCLLLRKNNSKKTKPFIGFTICICFFIIIGGILVYMCQSSSFAQCINDVITLFALFFSLSQIIWDYILNFIANKLKR